MPFAGIVPVCLSPVTPRFPVSQWSVPQPGHGMGTVKTRFLRLEIGGVLRVWVNGGLEEAAEFSAIPTE